MVQRFDTDQQEKVHTSAKDTVEERWIDKKVAFVRRCQNRPHFCIKKKKRVFS